jgi:diguanylate cyclase (GGDEF)-like protein
MPPHDVHEGLARIRRLAVLGDHTGDPATIHAALAAELLGALTVDEVQVHHLALAADRELVVTHMLGGAGRLSRFRARSDRPRGVAQVAATRQALLVSDSAETRAIVPDLAAAPRCGALLLPVIVEREVAAVVSAVRAVPAEPFSALEVEVAGTLVDQGAAALALVRARAEAGIDTVSGCMNHRAMRQRLDEEIKRAGRHSSPLACLMLDLDDFKLVNDRHGHQAGDVLLRGVAEALMSEFRAFDCVARYGGDEFVVILPNADVESASAAAQRALDRIDGVPARAAGERTSASIGVAQWKPPMSTDELLAAGDAALLTSKRTGKGRVTTARGDGRPGDADL